ncbi:glyoxylate/hydroxypyruvate reductase A [Azohydromonas sp.]|uniref:2-hydroxyacid dehydrogenase n=1 Tax=Azohydromonas sp. TaxID=1872666 RepID=UPI002C3A57D5|nr:glyoxylate/hydroxypyruvate reductase A [Azohydromonas sp.]HMM84731.1 glyoxylate/hydroxypyruvate reductase A [Azohydromonas sp.]
MDFLLSGDFDPAERERWRAALTAATGARPWCDGEAFDPAAIEVALVANPPPGRLAGLPALRLVHSLWAGVDRLLADPTLPAGVPLLRMVDPAMSAAMAETALWAVLALHRGFFAYARRQRERRWQPHAQRRADEVRVTVLGLGQMGHAAARRLVAQGYRVAGWTLRAPPPADDGIGRHAGAAALAPLLGASDIVVNLLPLTPATRGLIDSRFLAALPPGAGLVNLARGAHVVEADLLAALDAGRLRDAVLDVFAAEPLPADHPFWRDPRVTVLPHVAALTDERSAATVVAASLAAWRAGTPAGALTGWVDRQRGY